MNDLDWPFDAPPNTTSITTNKVLEGHPILLVTHDEDDGGWQFLCGTTNETRDIRIVGLGTILKRDSSVAQLAGLPLGWYAWRESPQHEWKSEPNSCHDNE